MSMNRFSSLDEVRAEIDRLDTAIVGLIAERAGCVASAAAFKKTSDDVKAPARVEQVIARVRGKAENAGVNPDIVEKTYRAMIGAFIEYELSVHAGKK